MTFRRRILLVFLVFSLLLVTFFSLALFLATHFVEDNITKSILASNVEIFDARYREQGDATSLVRTQFIRSYYRESHDYPAWLDSYGEGYHETESYQIAVHRLHDGRLVYFTFDEAQGVLDRYESAINSVFCGLIITLLVISIFLSIKLAERIAEPIESLATVLLGTDRTKQLALFASRDDELGVLSRSFNEVCQQLESFVAREKNFTRYVSHELRTPLTVIKNNIDMMSTGGGDEELVKRATSRMHRAVDTMEQQIELLLLLARETAIRDTEEIDVTLELEWLIQDFPNNRIQLSVIDKSSLSIHLTAFRGMVLNLIRNALEHGVADANECDLSIELNTNSITFINSLNEDKSLDSDKGFGLEIVGKLADATRTKFTTHMAKDRFCAELHWAGNSS